MVITKEIRPAIRKDENIIIMIWKKYAPLWVFEIIHKLRWRKWKRLMGVE